MDVERIQVDFKWMLSGCRVNIKWMSIGLMKLGNRGVASRVCRKRILSGCKENSIGFQVNVEWMSSGYQVDVNRVDEIT